MLECFQIEVSLLGLCLGLLETSAAVFVLLRQCLHLLGSLRLLLLPVLELLLYLPPPFYGTLLIRLHVAQLCLRCTHPGIGLIKRALSRLHSLGGLLMTTALLLCLGLQMPELSQLFL